MCLEARRPHLPGVVGILLVVLLAATAAPGAEKLGSTLRRLREVPVSRANVDKLGMHGIHKIYLDRGRAFVRVLIQADPAAAGELHRLGPLRMRRHGPVFTADVPVDSLDRLGEIEGVRAARAARRLEPHLDVSVPLLPSGSMGLDLGCSIDDTDPDWLVYTSTWTQGDGSGVIVGVVDSGIDVTHEDFFDASGNARIRYLWDQNTGEVCTASVIEAGTCSHEDTNGHGTHVAGTAAGNGLATGNGYPARHFVGVAPAADIIGVATTFYDADIIDGVAWVFEKAEQLGMPAVVNLSLGGHAGPHDGTDIFDIGLDALAGPGRVVVVSAGNEGEDFIHNQADSSGSNIALTFAHNTCPRPGPLYAGYLAFDIWHGGEVSYRVRVSEPGGTNRTWDVGELYNDKSTYDRCDVQVDNPASSETESNGDKKIEIIMDGQPKCDTWTITLIREPAGDTTSDHVDAWLWYVNWGTVFENGDNDLSVASPGTAESTVTVGAYVSKTTWPSVDGSTYWFGYENDRVIAPFSSLGPTRDGRLKPDITAPGSAIGAALSDFTYPDADTALILPDGVHRIMQGTSMSAPHVTGLTALLLAEHDSYIPAAIKSMLAYTARSDSYTGTTPSTTWGHGKADGPGVVGCAATNLPRCASASQLPSGPGSDGTLLASASGFVPKNAGSPARYLYQWQKHNGQVWENIEGAFYRRLEPGKLAAGDEIRLVATPYDVMTGILLLGASQTASQTIGSYANPSSHTGQTGWSMLSVPTATDDAVLGDFSGSFYGWNESLQAYEVATTAEHGRGYWVDVQSGEGFMHSEGAAAPSGDHVTPLLTYTEGLPRNKPGRHLLGNPFNQPIYWQNTLVSTDGTTFVPMDEAADAGLIHDTYYTDYDSTAASYQQFDPADMEAPDGKIFPWQAFWVLVRQPVYLAFPAGQTAPAGIGGSSTYPLPLHAAGRTSQDTAEQVRTVESTRRKPSVGSQPQTEAAAWRVKLSVSSGTLRDAYNYIGVHPEASDGYDRRDMPDAGTMNARHVMAFLRHEDWDPGTPDYSVDIRRAPARLPERFGGWPVQMWELTVASRGLAQPVDVTWTRPPDGWNLHLVDATAHRRVRMDRTQRYTYTPIGDEDRPVWILAVRTGQPAGDPHPVH